MDVMSLLTTWAGMADEDPEGFLTHFRMEWDRSGSSISKDSSEMSTLRDIKVLCEDGDRRSFSEIYLPVPKLVFICKRYLLDHESFGFVQLGKPLNREDGLGPWAFLESQLGARTKDDVDFYLQLLCCIRQKNTQGKIEFPRRIMELYLRIHAVCEASTSTEKARQQVRDSFEKHELSLLASSWTKPSNCLLHHLNYWLLKPAVLPAPESWESTEAECGVLKRFYQETLGISPVYSWIDVLASLEKAQGSTATFWYPQLRKFYRALDELLPNLSDEDKDKLRSFFNDKSYIGVVHNGSLLWYQVSSCVWAPELIVPTKIDLSDHYRGLKSFFTGFLKVPKYDCGLIYNDLLDLDPRETSVEEAKELLWSLNESLTECGHLLNHRSLLSRPIFPVRLRNGEVRLSPATSGFLIGDKQTVRQQFLDRIELLDFPAEDVWGLEPLILWADLEDRYLSYNIEEKTYLEKESTTKQTTQSFTASQARGLLRVARHFRSPRVRSALQRQNFILKLEQAKFFKTNGIYRQLSLNKSNFTAVADKQPSDLHIDDLEDQLRIYISDREGAYEFCFVSTLPRHLVEWMMAEPSAEDSGRSTTAAVSAVKSILNVSDALINDVLIEEGIIGEDDTELLPQPSANDNAKPFEQEVVQNKPLEPQRELNSNAASADGVPAERETIDDKAEPQNGLNTSDPSPTSQPSERSANDEPEPPAEPRTNEAPAQNELVKGVTGEENLERQPELDVSDALASAKLVVETTGDEESESDLDLSDGSSDFDPIGEVTTTHKEESQSGLNVNDTAADAKLVEKVTTNHDEESESDLDESDASSDDNPVGEATTTSHEEESQPHFNVNDAEAIANLNDEVTSNHNEDSESDIDESDDSSDGNNDDEATSDDQESESDLDVNDESANGGPVGEVPSRKEESQLDLNVSDRPENGNLVDDVTTGREVEPQTDANASNASVKDSDSEGTVSSEEKSETFVPPRLKRKSSSIPRRRSSTLPKSQLVFVTPRGEERSAEAYEFEQQAHARMSCDTKIPSPDFSSPGAKRKEPWKIVGSKNCIL